MNQSPRRAGGFLILYTLGRAEFKRKCCVLLLINVEILRVVFLSSVANVFGNLWWVDPDWMPSATKAGFFTPLLL